MMPCALCKRSKKSKHNVQTSTPYAVQRRSGQPRSQGLSSLPPLVVGTALHTADTPEI